MRYSCYKTILSGPALFTSFAFCNNTGSYSLRLNTRIYICIHSSIFYLLELAVMINLHNSASNFSHMQLNLPTTCRQLNFSVRLPAAIRTRRFTHAFKSRRSNFSWDITVTQSSHLRASFRSMTRKFHSTFL